MLELASVPALAGLAPSGAGLRCRFPEQQYQENDIGFPKATVLADRLRCAVPGASVDGLVADAVELLAGANLLPQFDLIIDATANRSVAAALELRRWTAHDDRQPPLLSVMVGHRCERAVATLDAPGASGAGVDTLRQLAIDASADEQLRDVLDDFFPDPPRTEPFLPEPGCSDPTFVGSAMDLAAYAGQLLTDAVARLGSPLPSNALVPLRTATVVRSPELTEQGPAVQRLEWRNDLVHEDTEHDYQIRVASSALADLRRETARAAATRGPGCETGGLLLGQIDRGSRVVWVTDAQQPPPGSAASASGLLFDPAAARASVSDRRFRTRGLVTYIGAWHTHPIHGTTRSTIDLAAMETLAQQGDPVLLLIIGGDRDRWVRWLGGRQTPAMFIRLFFPR